MSLIDLRQVLAVSVHARPAVQGNHRVSRAGYIYEQVSGNLLDWRREVSLHARLAMRSSPPVEGPVRVLLEFAMAAPKRGARPWPTTRPDIDKLTRAVLDALTGIAYVDDSQVIALAATKVYGDPGCLIEVYEITEAGHAP